MKWTSALVGTCLTLLTVLVAYSNTDRSVVRLWTKHDLTAHSPGTRNPLVPGYFADPAVIEDKGTFYIYATSDLPKWDDINKLAVWISTDFVNWECKYLNWPDREQCKSETGNRAGVWAPSVVRGRDGRFYMYVTVGEEIWVGVADHPAGPWRNAVRGGGPLIRHKEFYYVQTIDAECFIDDDGAAYLLWGSAYSGWQIEGRCLVARLNPDMATLAEAPQDVTPEHYFEAPYMLKRNDIYYLMYSWGYTWDESYQVRYSTGKTPFGPWKEGMMRPILGTDERDENIRSTGHNAILHHDGKDYILYHRFNILGQNVSGKLRQLCADELIFNADGSIQRVVTTNRGIGALGSLKAAPNLAAGKLVTASSIREPSCSPSHLTDENNGTLWIGGNGPEEWAKVDLGDKLPIRKIELFPEFPIYPYKYKVEVSEDDLHWRLIEDRSSNEQIGSPLISNCMVSGRYIRVTLFSSQGAQRPALWEIKVR